MKLRDKCYKSPRRTLRVAPLLQRGYKANGDFQKYAPFEKGGSRAAAGDFGSGERGITLLEIMFVMIIAAMITTAAFMYYGSVQRNQEINNAIQLIQQIITAVDNYRHPIDIEYIDGVPQSENAYKDYYEGLNTNVVANSGFIPQQYLQSGDSGEMEGLGITTPWFGT
ncbi:MAG: hypothetical protein K0R24_2342, partial [Gammaproteobacteria bacterium]|nr:hypothetical protein [Gammaproteobacteria bacterium]